MHYIERCEVPRKIFLELLFLEGIVKGNLTHLLIGEAFIDKGSKWAQKQHLDGSKIWKWFKICDKWAQK